MFCIYIFCRIPSGWSIKRSAIGLTHCTVCSSFPISLPWISSACNDLISDTSLSSSFTLRSLAQICVVAMESIRKWPFCTVSGWVCCHSFYIRISFASRGNPRLHPACERREQITTRQLKVNEGVLVVGSQRQTMTDCYLNCYTSVCIGNVGELL